MSSEDLLKTYREYARTPEVSAGSILSVGATAAACQTLWSTRNLCTLKRTVTSCQQHINFENGTVTPANHTPTLDNAELLTVNDGKEAWLVQCDGESQLRYIMVLDTSQPPLMVDLSKTKLHANVYTDEEIGGSKFSADGSLLAYTAEEYTPTGTSLLTPASDLDKEGHGEKFIKRIDWGEQLTGKCRSVLVVIPANKDSTDAERIVLNPPQEYGAVGQLQWAGPNSLVGVAVIDSSPRPGIIYCRIRESVLFYVNLQDKKFVELSPRQCWVGCPRFSPDGGCLVYLRGAHGGQHVRQSQLVFRDWPSCSPAPLQQIEPTVAVDFYPEETEVDGGLFSGIYGSQYLPKRCFIDSSSTLAFHTVGRYTQQSYIVNLKSRTIKRVPSPEMESSTILDASSNGWVLLSRSSFTKTSSVVLHSCKVDAEGNISFGASYPLVEGNAVEPVPVDWCQNWVLSKNPPHPDERYNSVPVPALYFGPSQSTGSAPLRPLILFIHGGPHSILTSSYSPLIHMMVALGYSIVFPNYRGSLGVGDRGLDSLPGHVGFIDVEDCHAVAIETLRRYEGVVDPQNVFLMGGSHGGFLVTSLAAKYPDSYRAVSTRNPVTDITSLVATSDIPDWAYVESCGTGDYFTPPTLEQLSKMREASPLFAIDRVRIPILLQLGTEDRRVPMAQGFKYYELLRHRGVPCKLLVYEDSHALRKVEVEGDCFMQTLQWFTLHTNN